jgi:hypothetical protein
MKRISQIAAIAAAVSCLAACSGSTDTMNGSGSQSSGTGVVAGMLDSFGQAVQAIIGTTSETTTPVSIDAIAVTTPDNTQPAVITP